MYRLRANQTRKDTAHIENQHTLLYLFIKEIH